MIMVYCFGTDKPKLKSPKRKLIDPYKHTMIILFPILGEFTKRYSATEQESKTFQFVLYYV